MNIFESIMKTTHDAETSLGHPLRDPMAIERRLTHFAQMTGGKGFRTPKKEPVKNAQGLTRGDRKRIRFERAFKAA
jgi:hypothetical protein